MKTAKMLVWLCILAIVIASFLDLTHKTTNAQDSSGSDETVLAKLDQILNNQRTILDHLSFMKEELNIIKIRITQQQ